MEKSQLATLIKHRSRQLRREMTEAERRLWNILNKHQVNGFRFRRQHPIGHYIADFVCLEARLVVEVDGSQHVDKQYDCERTDWLKNEGYTVIRFWNNEVIENLEGVLEEIVRVLEDFR